MKETVEDCHDGRSKVLLVSHAFPPDVGGAQYVALQNARALSRVYEVEVLTGTSASPEWDAQFDFEVTRLSIPFGLWPLHYARALTARSECNYKAVVFNDPASIYSGGLASPSSLLERGVCYLHGSEPELFYLNPQIRYRLLWFQHYFERALEGCQVIVPVSEFMEQKFIEQTGLGRFRSKMRVVHAGVDRSTFYPDPTDIRDRHNIERCADILLSASRIVEKKGYAQMLKNFTELRRAGHSFHWIIAGDGPYRKTLLRDVEQAGMSQWVTWVGELSQDVLRTYYSSVDLFWLLSEFQEAFGLVYLEANACGTPVIGRELGGVREAIEDRINGFLVANQTECKKILAKKQYKKIKRKDVLDWANTFEVEATVERLQTVIDEVATSTEFSEKDI